MGGVVSQSIPNFLNGLSQQTPTQRGINQGEDQVNFANNIVDGLSKRPPLDYVSNLDGTNLYPNTTKFCLRYDHADNKIRLYNITGDNEIKRNKPEIIQVRNGIFESLISIRLSNKYGIKFSFMLNILTSNIVSSI